MADPLVISFAADTSRAQAAMQNLAASVIANMAATSVAMTGVAANANSTGGVLGALASNLSKAAAAVSGDVKNISAATVAAATKDKATLEGVVGRFTAAAAASQTAQAGVKAGLQGTVSAVATLASQLPILTALATGFVGFAAIKLALDVVTAAAAAASVELDRMAKVGAEASKLGVSTTFLQTFTAQARELKLEADDLTKSLERAKGAFTVTQGEGSHDARNQSQFEARLRQQVGAGNATQGQLNSFTSANGLEAQYRAALEIVSQIQAKGKEIAAIDLASRFFTPDMVDRLRSGALDLDKFKKSIDDIKNPDLILLSPEEIVRAQELQRRLSDAENTLNNAAREFNIELGRAGAGLREDAIAWKELMASGARIAVSILTQARKIRDDFTNSEPAVYGRDYYRPEDAPKSGLKKDLGGSATAKPTGDPDMDAALNKLRGNLGNRTLIDQAQAASKALADGARGPDRKTNPIDTSRAKPERSGASETDPVATFIGQIEKQAAALKAETEAFSKSNAEKSIAIQLAKANEVASQNGKTLTDAQTAAIRKAAEETANYRDKLADLEQAQRQAADAARYFGDIAANSLGDAILEGRSFGDVLSNIEKQIARSTLQAAFTGQGPLAGLLGTAAPASAGSNAVGGLLGSAIGAFGKGGGAGGLGAINGVPVQGPSLPGGSFLDTIGSFFRANGGPVSAGVPYTVGEMGREMFVPNQNGQIVPIAQGGAGGGPTNLNTGGNTYNITPANGVTPEQLRATLKAYDAEQQRTIFARWQENKRRFG